ncbi:MAG: hypothetical protein WEC59_13410 [Salibacteraceae bacterium]
MPATEMLLKDLNALFLMVRNAITGKRTKRILAHPHFPSRGSTIYRIAISMGFEVTNKPSRSFDLAIYWEYATERTEYELLESVSAKSEQRVINLYNRNSAKDQVDDWMQGSFGYSTRVDPEAYSGEAVRKSFTNAVHDGRLIHCPTKPETGFIYQKFIDSSVNDKEVMDLRVVIMGKEIPHLYLNYRENDQRFKNVPYRAELCQNIHEQLSEEEVSQLLKFCALAKLEFGELDVLRDCHDQLIYVVDANNTPQGPPKHLPAAQKKQAMESYVSSFRRQFM